MNLCCFIIANRKVVVSDVRISMLILSRTEFFGEVVFHFYEGVMTCSCNRR